MAKQKIIIIGGGVAGLTAGIYAQKAGFDSEIYEKHSIMGGQCTGWKRNGFYIDNCISWMTCGAPEFPIYNMWKEVGFLGDENGNEIPVRYHDAFYTSELNGQTVTLWRDLDRAEREMIEISPEDKKLIKSLFKKIRMCRHLQVPHEAPLDMMNLWQLTKLGIRMLPVGISMLLSGKTSLADLENKFKHPLLKKMITDYLPKDYLEYIWTNAYGTISSSGGGVPDGGSSKVIERMCAIYKKAGGKIFAKAAVKKILVEKTPGVKKEYTNGILLETGETVTGDYVIAAADPYHTFHNLLDEKYMPPHLRVAYDNPEINKLVSSFQVAFEYNGETKDIGRRTFFDCEPFELAGVPVTRMNMKNYDLEPTTAPTGKNLIQIKILQNEQRYLYWKNLYEKDKDEYNRQKLQAAMDIQKRLEKRVPSAKGKLKLLDIWTPFTYTRYCNAHRGVYMSFIITKDSPNLFNIKGVVNDIDNLFLASQWLCMPGGLPMAMTSGKFAIQRILRSQHKSINLLP